MEETQKWMFGGRVAPDGSGGIDFNTGKEVVNYRRKGSNKKEES